MKSTLKNIASVMCPILPRMLMLQWNPAPSKITISFPSIFVSFLLMTVLLFDARKFATCYVLYRIFSILVHDFFHQQDRVFLLPHCLKRLVAQRLLPRVRQRPERSGLLLKKKRDEKFPTWELPSLKLTLVTVVAPENEWGDSAYFQRLFSR